MRSQQARRRPGRVQLLVGAVALVVMIVAAAIVVPLFDAEPLRAAPKGPAPGGGSTALPSAKSSSIPTKTGATKPSGKGTSKKPMNSPPGGSHKSAGGQAKRSSEKAESAKPYNGSGEIPDVKTHRRMINKSAATQILGTYLKAVPKIDPDTKNVKKIVSNIAGTAIQQELASQLSELSSNGWTLNGTPVVTSAKIISKHLNATPPSVTVKACVDSTHVMTLDAKGKKVGSGPPAPPAYNIYELHQQPDGSWRLASHSFPDNPTC